MELEPTLPLTRKWRTESYTGTTDSTSIKIQRWWSIHVSGSRSQDDEKCSCLKLEPGTENMALHG